MVMSRTAALSSQHSTFYRAFTRAGGCVEAEGYRCRGNNFTPASTSAAMTSNDTTAAILI